MVILALKGLLVWRQIITLGRAVPLTHECSTSNHQREQDSERLRRYQTALHKPLRWHTAMR